VRTQWSKSLFTGDHSWPNRDGRAESPDVVRRREILRGSLAALIGLGLKPSAAWAAFDKDEFVTLDATAQAELIRTGQASAREIVEAAIARIERLNPVVNAVCTTEFDRALDVLSRPLGEGPFAGVPYLIKELTAVNGSRVTYGSRAFQNNIAQNQSAYVDRLLDLGFVVLGRSNSPEFGLLGTTEPILFGATRNPWNPDYNSHGSSGGSAAAVATGIVPMADATDGGGSIRIPASACGVFGLKVSRGRMPRMSPPDVVIDLLAVQHCVSRSVRDSARLFAAMEDRTSGSISPVGLVERPITRGLRIAYSTASGYGAAVHRDCVAAVRSTAELLEELGHRVEEQTFDYSSEAFQHHFMVLWSALAAGAVASVGSRPGRRRLNRTFEPWTLGLADYFQGLPRDAVPTAVEFMSAIAREYEAFHRRYDAYLTPVMAAPPVRNGAHAPDLPYAQLLERVTSQFQFTPIVNAVGACAMSVPLHWSDDGLPIGCHFSAALGNEGELLALAYQLEAARPWANRWAPVSALYQ
jgi:amidase